MLIRNNYQVVLQWIPSHLKIVENEIADNAAKAGHSRILVESSIITFDYVKGQINRKKYVSHMGESMATMQVKRQML